MQRYVFFCKQQKSLGLFKRKNRLFEAVAVICNRFELLTSCLSSKRSKPTELTDHFSCRKRVQKYEDFFNGQEKFLVFDGIGSGVWWYIVDY